MVHPDHSTSEKTVYAVLAGDSVKGRQHEWLEANHPELAPQLATTILSCHPWKLQAWNWGKDPIHGRTRFDEWNAAGAVFCEEFKKWIGNGKTILNDTENESFGYKKESTNLGGMAYLTPKSDPIATTFRTDCIWEIVRRLVPEMLHDLAFQRNIHAIHVSGGF
ncbi:uncharacterized protein EI90DRAFT_3014006 [Cantharellus anzutake]|uniref:uncharacterized protein n=1 Tax=Cantharellus anzutake TaxID=1750568 RepID=UPI001903572B|nr:uncharacterized protein EI90DRAFT_3014006 [Cantharellus anzutake]KAF8337058.1 hypothetical protein EI90DRAFT_3014006 [Cantharellus anzutake]